MRKLILFCLLLLFINQASAYDKTFYEGNKTLVIQQSITGKTLFTIQQAYTLEGSDSRGQFFVEVFNITSYLTSDYTFSVSDIEFSWKQFKGNNNITNADFFLFKASNYSVLVNDYGINSTYRSREVYNNQTGLNDTVWYWDNKTVVVGNHSEVRDNSTWLKLNNLNGKVIKPGKSYTIKVVFTKNFEKEFSIQTIPSFIGVPDDRMTWWNASYYETPILVDNTGNASILIDFQVSVNNTYNSTTMDANFTSFHLINRTSNTEMVGRFWINRTSSINGSYAIMTLNLSLIPASAWDNTTFALAHRNVTEVDGSSGTGTFNIFTNNLTGWSEGTAGGTWVDTSGYIEQTAAGWSGTKRYPSTYTTGIWEADITGDDGIKLYFISSNGLSDSGYNVYAWDANSLYRNTTQLATASVTTTGNFHPLKITRNDTGFMTATLNDTFISATDNTIGTSAYISIRSYNAAKWRNIRHRKTTGFVDPTAQLGVTEAGEAIREIISVIII